MAGRAIHKFASTVPDGADNSVSRPSDWNADHELYLDVNAQTGTSYALLAADDASLVTFSNAAAIAVSIAQAASGSPVPGTLAFKKGWFAILRNKGAGIVTITPTTSTVNGAASFALRQNQGCILMSDGTDYQAVPLGSNLVFDDGSAVTVRAATKISLNATALPAGLTGTALQVANDNAVNTRVLVDSFGTSVISGVDFRKARGTAASPTAVQSDDTIGQIAALGYGASAYSVAERAAVRLVANENWTNTAQGTYLSFLVTAAGGTTLAEVFRLLSTGATITGALTTTTINAFTLAGTIAGGGNQLNNVIIGNSTPLAGSFTMLGASGVVSFTNNTTASSTAAAGAVFTGGVAIGDNLRVANTGNFGALTTGTPALGTTGGNATSASVSLAITDTNVTQLYFYAYRTGNGSSHSTSEWRIRRRVDSSDMSYVGFGSNYASLSGNGGETCRADINEYLLVGYTSSNGAYKLQVNSQIFATNATVATSDLSLKNIIAAHGDLNMHRVVGEPKTFAQEFLADVIGAPIIYYTRKDQPEYGARAGYGAQHWQALLERHGYANSGIVTKLNNGTLALDEGAVHSLKIAALTAELAAVKSQLATLTGAHHG